MKTKFEHGETVLYKGEETVIKVAQKNFGTQKISYLLENGEKVNESELSKPKKTNPVQLPKAEKKDPLKELHEKYEKAYKKPVPNAKKNDALWIDNKLTEAGVPSKEVTTDGWSVLSALDQNALEIFIKEKELDIDLNDYVDEDSLRIAVAEELNIEIPS